MTVSNPSLIQGVGEGSDSNPLFLIHDGSGMDISYKLLEPLGRPVYSIYDPTFDGTGRSWENGIPEMAAFYVEMIRTIIKEGDFLLGGHSFGAYVSLEMAKVLSQDSKLHVLGVIMIDDIYLSSTNGSGAGKELQALVDDLALSYSPALHESLAPTIVSGRRLSPEDKLETKQRAQSCMSRSFFMTKDWKVPVWDAISPPPIILLRATGYIPVPQSMPGVNFPMDLLRHYPLLGWEEHEAPFIKAVSDIRGHHFSLFETSNVQSVTRKLGRACEMLENGIPKPIIGSMSFYDFSDE